MAYCAAILCAFPQITAFLKKLPVDSLWLDMNEPSNFCDGACEPSHNITTQVLGSSNILRPPYTLGNRKLGDSGTAHPLNEKTLDMDVKHHGGDIAYNMHNLFGKGRQLVM